MPIIAGDNEATYDHVGEWTKHVTVTIESSPGGLAGAVAAPCAMYPGGVKPGDTVHPVTVSIGSEEVGEFG